MQTAILQFSMIVFRSISILALVYVFFLPWPSSFGQSGYGDNFGYGSGYGFRPQFDLSGIWIEEATSRKFLIWHIQEEDGFVAIEYWADANNPGLASGTLYVAALDSQVSYDNYEYVGLVVTDAASNHGLRFESSIYKINDETLLFRLDSCEDTISGGTADDLCNNITIGERRTLVRLL